MTDKFPPPPRYSSASLFISSSPEVFFSSPFRELLAVPLETISGTVWCSMAETIDADPLFRSIVTASRPFARFSGFLSGS